MRYCKRPGTVNAYQLTTDNLYHLAWWCGGDIKGTALAMKLRVIDLIVGESELRIEMGDYVIQAEDGSFSVLPADVFEKAYEKVGQ